MKKVVMFAVLAGGALTLAACGGKTEEAPAAEPTAVETMAPAAEATPEAEDELDPTGNPIGMGAPAEATADGEAAPAAE